jgi:hypothetical protein
MTTLASVLAGLVTYELERSPVKAARLGLTVSGPLLPDMSEAAVTASPATTRRGSPGWQPTNNGRTCTSTTSTLPSPAASAP